MVQDLCDSAIWLDHGEIVMSGPVSNVVEACTGTLASVE
jgi:ABC-type polysaccharide/polyol phosphate transport system ATPase subunit